MQIECQNLTVGYDGRAILKDINFTVNRGDYLCIIGENGAGKTTLLRTLLGLQPPVSGKILFGDGLERKGCGYLPQQTATQEMLFLDEPVSGLDPVATEEMYRLIEQINRDDHITILMISHDIKAAVTYADHILEIGKQIFLGTAQEYLERT